MSLLAELKRRNVIRVGIAYVLGAWVLLQIADFALDLVGAPNWVIQGLSVLAAIGLPVALVASWVFELTPGGIKREKDIDRAHPAATETGRRLDRTIIGILVVAVAVFAWDRYSGNTGPTKNAVDGARSKAEPAPGRSEPGESGMAAKSIAVLPFTTRSTSEDDRFFSDGMHDDLLTQLAKIDSFRVISRTSVMEYRDTTKNLRQIGRELGAGAILEGAVQRAGQQVRINVQLIDAETDEHLWAETYDRALSIDNLFAIQSEMARSIAAALETTLGPSTETELDQPPTDNLEALDAFHRARALSHFFIRDDLDRAEVEARLAVDLDPRFAEAWALLAHIKLSQWWGVEEDPAYLEAARSAIDTGRAIRPDLTELDIAEGYYRYWGFLDYEGALQVLEPLLPDNPNNAELLQVTAFVHRRFGNWAEALDLMHQAEPLAPRDLGLFYSIGETYAVLRRWDAAQRYLEKAEALDPSHARVQQLKGDIIAGRDGDFIRAARYTGQAKQDLRFLANQHLEMLLAAKDRDGALAAAGFMEEDGGEGLGQYTGLPTALAHAYFGELEAARPDLEASREALLAALSAMKRSDPGPGERGKLVQLHFTLCQVAGALQAADDAITHARAALQFMPDDAMGRPMAIANLGTCLAWAGAHDEAMEMLMRLAGGRPGLSAEWFEPDLRLSGLRDHSEWRTLLDSLGPVQ